MWTKRKQLVIATAIIGLLGVAAPSLMAFSGNTPSPFGQGNPLDNLQGQINRLSDLIQGLLSPPPLTKLTGDYYTISNLDCLNNAPAFGDGLTVNLANGASARIVHQTTVVTTHYNGDGTGTESGSGMTVADVIIQGASPIYTYVTTCDVANVIVKADGSFTQERKDCAVTVTYPNDATMASTMQGTVPVQGRIVNGGKMLLFAGVTPTVETSITPNGPGQKVCTRTGVATKIN